MSDDERVPFQITAGAAAYEMVRQLPVSVLLDNLRSAYNVGAFFRTADAVRVEKLLLCGISSAPPNKGVLKTSLGADHLLPSRAPPPFAVVARNSHGIPRVRQGDVQRLSSVAGMSPVKNGAKTSP